MIHRRNSKPVIFVEDEGNASLKEVLLEEYKNFDIYWFHWPYDGLFIFPDDYEPVVMIYKARTICCLITRRNWTYQTYTLDEGLVTPPEILFATTFHHPIAKTREEMEDFDAMKQDLIQQPYEPKRIKPNEIPKKFRVGEGHPTNIMNLWRVRVDPAVYARKTYNQFVK